MEEMRTHAVGKFVEHEGDPQTMSHKDVQHFRQESNGPLANITDLIKDQYRTK